MGTDEGTEASENNDPDEAGKTSPDDGEGYGDTHGEADGGVVVHDTLSLGGLEVRFIRCVQQPYGLPPAWSTP